jgi:hypothetical protein
MTFELKVIRSSAFFASRYHKPILSGKLGLGVTDSKESKTATSRRQLQRPGAGYCVQNRPAHSDLRRRQVRVAVIQVHRV